MERAKERKEGKGKGREISSLSSSFLVRSPVACSSVTGFGRYLIYTSSNEKPDLVRLFVCACGQRDRKGNLAYESCGSENVQTAFSFFCVGTIISILI